MVLVDLPKLIQLEGGIVKSTTAHWLWPHYFNNHIKVKEANIRTWRKGCRGLSWKANTNWGGGGYSKSTQCRETLKMLSRLLLTHPTRSEESKESITPPVNFLCKWEMTLRTEYVVHCPWYLSLWCSHCQAPSPATILSPWQFVSFIFFFT